MKTFYRGLLLSVAAIIFLTGWAGRGNSLRQAPSGAESSVSPLPSEETAAVAGTRAREEEGADAGEMEALFRERAEGKCILFPTPSASVEITDAEVTVSARVSRGRFGLTVEKKMAVTHPEKEIRDRKRLIDTE